MKVLVTGGAGFIGSHLSEALLGKGCEIHIIDNLSTGSVKNIKHLARSKKFHFVKGSVTDERAMEKLVRKTDVIFHLAAAVGVKYIIDHPLESIKTNVHGTETVLRLADALGKKKVFLASTSEIYGKDRGGGSTFAETDDRLLGSTTKWRWSYSCAKALDEFLSLAYYRERKLPVVIGRFFNTCGPRQTGRYGMVIPRFIKQALSGKPITVFGDGKQTRCFLYVGDAVKGVLALTEKKKAIGEIFNIGNPGGISILGLAEKIKKLTNSRSKIVFVPYEKVYKEGFEDMRHRKPDISKIRSCIGFTPTVGIDELLKRTIKCFKG